ncbi:MAG TPA: hypothetical protein VMC41_01420 [Candidatus Nanoarchaeia archaeon]|nr:hypothetical protein [Candidatus Nanoarchaeia archaeon]
MITDHRIIEGKYFVLDPVDQIYGTVVKVVTGERRRRNFASPRLFDKGFYLLYINEHNGNPDPSDDELTTVLLDDNVIPKAELTGDNDVEGKKIIICRERAIIRNEPGHRVIRGSFFVLRKAAQILGRAIEVITEERRTEDTRECSLFARGMYLLYVDEQKEEGEKTRPLTLVLLDRDIISISCFTEENSIEGKVVMICPDQIQVIR